MVKASWDAVEAKMIVRSLRNVVSGLDGAQDDLLFEDLAYDVEYVSCVSSGD